MKRLFQFLVFVPLAIVLIAISVANREPIAISLDPFSATAPAIVLSVPIFWVIFACLLLGIVMGGTVVWLKQGRFRTEAREQKYAAAVARNEAKKSKAQAERLAQAALPAPKNV